MSQYPVIPFSRLSISTDLSPPPGNWLRWAFEFPREFNSAFPTYSGFTSFALSTAFPDLVHSADVISDSENIKKLLKIAYDPESPISMVVHRVGKSLLIDDLDIQKYLLRAVEKDWKWLKKVLMETVEPSTHYSARVRSSYAAEERNLLSKFLYRSLSPSCLVAPSISDKTLAHQSRGIDTRKVLPPLPEPSVEDKLPQLPVKNRFARNLIWNFEDIRMLIGSDMPIFGDSEHPCVSLRLRNTKNPINILTGLDYWLDNLMCQVPEVLMCFHLDGIVQRYELHKTEDLPSLGSSKFSPKVIRDVARNILSFLGSNATQEGHTYWLFKAQNDDVVKLYDLTSICEDYKAKCAPEQDQPESNGRKAEDDTDGDNPFRTAVCMLLYKVARNIMQSDQRIAEVNTVRRLLKNCLKLLDTDKYPQIATSTHFMLSDLLVPEEIDPSYPEFPVFESELIESYCNGRDLVSDIDIQSLIEDNVQSDNKKNLKEPAAVVTNESNINMSLDEKIGRCKESLLHVLEGFKYLKNYIILLEEKNEKVTKEQENFERENSKMCKSNVPIPMPYNDDASSVSTTKVECFEHRKQQKLDWHGHFKTALFRKASLIYITLSELYFMHTNYGRTLRYIRNSLQARRAVISPDFQTLLTEDDKNCFFFTFAWGVAGDSYMSMVNNWSDLVRYHEEYNSTNESDLIFAELLDDEHRDRTIKFPKDLEESMLLAVKCLRLSADHLCGKESFEKEYWSVLKRLGNIENEIGVFYMNQASNLSQNSEPSLIPHVKELFEKSLSYLKEGIRHFEIINDTFNISLLNSNCGILCRSYAFSEGLYDIKDKEELIDFEYEQYCQAVHYYEVALKTIGYRKNNPPIWDSITWEISTTLYAIGTLLQDFAPVSSRPRSEVEKLVTDNLIRALKYCDIETQGPKLPLYQYRAGIIHHRLASMYHHGHRGDFVIENETRRYNLKKLAELHYGKAEVLFFALDNQYEYLKVIAEQIGLLEFQLNASAPSQSKTKIIKQVLETVVKTIPVFENLKQEEGEEKRDKVISLLLKRLQQNLLSLNKILLAKKKGKKPNNSWSKRLYSMSLQLDASTNDFVESFVQVLRNVKSEVSLNLN